MQFPIEYLEEAHGYGKGKSPGSAAAWIEVEHLRLSRAAAPFAGSLVSVAADHADDARGYRFERYVVHIVDEVEAEAAKIDEFSLGQFCAGAVGVDVTADGGDRRDLSKARKDADIAYVAGVKNMIDAAQRRQNFRAKLGVGVRDNADLHISITTQC